MNINFGRKYDLCFDQITKNMEEYLRQYLLQEKTSCSPTIAVVKMTEKGNSALVTLTSVDKVSVLFITKLWALLKWKLALFMLLAAIL